MQNKIEYLHHKHMALKFAFSAPFIYAMVVPTVFLDLCMEIYHRICFPMYGLKLLRREDYISVIDRTKLPYLTWYEKLNCGYCGYVNGVMRYACALASETERYWCGIRHAQSVARPSEVEKAFLPYGDEKAYNEFVEKGKDIHDNQTTNV